MTTQVQQQDETVAFVSYAREDKEFVLKLITGLKEHSVEAIGDWLLTPGQKYEMRLREMNLSCHAFIFVISPDSIRSEACRNELALAVESRKQILPLSRRDHGEDSVLDSALRAPQWTYFRDENDFQSGITGLIKAINTDFELMEMHGRLLLASESWKDNRRNGSYLLRKDGLREAEGWLAKTSVQPDQLPQPTPLEVEFILAGQRTRGREARISIGIAMAVVLSLIVLAVIALAQRSKAVQQAKIAITNEGEARHQQSAAEENARRAFEVAKRRLVVATLLVNAEGTKFTTFAEFPNGDLLFGLMPWDRRTLSTILRRFQAEEPEVFVKVFGDGDASLANRLIDHTATPLKRPLDDEELTEERELANKNAPHAATTFEEFNLAEEPWFSRFQKAGKEPALQAVQLRAFTESYLRYLDELRQIEPRIKTERGVAFLLDLAFQVGPGRAKKDVQEAQKAEPTPNESDLLLRIAEISTARIKRGFPRFAPMAERRRQIFLTTPFLSDKELGFQ